MLKRRSSGFNAFNRVLGNVLLAATLALGGCGLLPEVVDETAGWSAQKLYAEAKDNLNSGNYERAVKLFETLESRYPFGRYAQQAQLDVAYAYYKDNEPISAIAACDRFIKLHPNHPNVDYAYYLKGLANFNEDLGLLGGLVDQDMSERDPRAARDAFLAFKELVTRFPDSQYAADSTARMKYLVNALASNEVHVAKYYLKRKAWVAAANRAKEVLKTYPEAPAMEEALAIMVVAYDELGLVDLRDDAQRVLKLNFPDSKYAKGVSIQEKAWYRFW
jgi:outer membrane protein assembly factor BamD